MVYMFKNPPESFIRSSYIYMIVDYFLKDFLCRQKYDNCCHYLGFQLYIFFVSKQLSNIFSTTCLSDKVG